MAVPTVSNPSEPDDLLEATTAPIATPSVTKMLPGLALALIATVFASMVNTAVPQISALMVAVIIGMGIGNSSDRVDVFRPGLAISAKKLVRVGVVLLGLRLSVGEVTDLGVPTIALVVGTVTITFFGTQALGRRMGLSRGLSLLVATGYSICGASAIAAMEGTAEAEEEEVALSIGLVTLAGSAAMFVIPALSRLLGLSNQQFGTWAGASIHDVAQVVAAASAGGASVLAIAVVVKLTRIVLLAPLVAGVSVHRSRQGANHHVAPDTKRPPLLPAFVVGFLTLMLVRTFGWASNDAIEWADTLSGWALTMALVGLGSGVRVSRLRKLGGAPLLLGALAWFLVAAVSLAGTLIIV